MSRSTLTKTLLALALVTIAGASHAGDVVRGKEKAAACAACHGADGNSASPMFPRLAGQHEDYITHALGEYKSGKRKDPIMSPNVAKLEKQDFEDLAAYFASQKGLATAHR
ncbi:cytochrome c [Niveibacterium sp. SC-1]|uniref:c-type cytochrome n=1 Tax=Niveibacterium sp. SC-1 TaxID=3135646 RepID=UPI00311DAA76